MHHRLQRWVIVSVVVVGLLAVACGVATQMLRTHDQDVTIYSVTPEGKVQVIGLRHRTYLLDYGGERDLVLFSTTFGTGVTTYGRKEDIYPADRNENHKEQKWTATTIKAYAAR